MESLEARQISSHCKLMCNCAGLIITITITHLLGCKQQHPVHSPQSGMGHRHGSLGLESQISWKDFKISTFPINGNEIKESWFFWSWKLLKFPKYWMGNLLLKGLLLLRTEAREIEVDCWWMFHGATQEIGQLLVKKILVVSSTKIYHGLGSQA